MTYLDIQTEVRQNIIDLPTTVTNRVPSLINRAMKEMQQRHNFQVMASTLQLNTTLDTRTLGSLPADFKEWNKGAGGQAFWLSDAGAWTKVTFASQTAARLAFDEVLDSGSPVILVQSDPSDIAGGATLSVYPLPDGNSDYSDGEYRLYIPYWKYLAALSANGDTNWFTVNADEYLIHQATAYGFLADWDEERFGIWRQIAEEKYDKAVKADKRFAVSGLDTLVPHMDVYAPGLRM